MDGKQASDDDREFGKGSSLFLRRRRAWTHAYRLAVTSESGQSSCPKAVKAEWLLEMRARARLCSTKDVREDPILHLDQLMRCRDRHRRRTSELKFSVECEPPDLDSAALEERDTAIAVISAQAAQLRPRATVAEPSTAWTMQAAA